MKRRNIDLHTTKLSHCHGIRICACLLGRFFAKKEPKLHKLGVIWANYCKKHPICSKLGAFLSKMIYWWVENWLKQIGIEKVRFSRFVRHIHVRFWWEYAPSNARNQSQVETFKSKTKSGGGGLSGKVGTGMCGPDRVLFRPPRFTNGPFFIWNLVWI